MRHPTRLAAAFTASMFLLFGGCDKNRDSRDYKYLRSASNFSVDTVSVQEIQSVCSETQFVEHFGSESICRNTRIFKLRWERPDDTTGFLGYRVFQDTTPTQDGTTWENIKRDRSKDALAELVVVDFSRRRDSIYFHLTDKLRSLPDTLKIDSRRPFVAVFDTVGGIDTTDSPAQIDAYMLALLTRYSNKQEGEPKYTPLVVDDQFAPAAMRPSYRVGARELLVEWKRPKDPTSFFNPAADSGLISHYLVEIEKKDTTGGRDLTPTVAYFTGSLDRSSEVMQVGERRNTKDVRFGVTFRLPDSARARPDSVGGGADSIRVRLGNLTPRDTITIVLSAVDSNENVRELLGETHILTDTTQPAMSRFLVPQSLSGEFPARGVHDSSEIGNNHFRLAWTKSRDTVADTLTGALRPADSADFNIEEYHLIRRSAFDTVISILPLSTLQSSDSVHLMGHYFLPPGESYHLELFAVDSTGHRSRSDTLTLQTIPVEFAGDSLTCPKGMVPIQAGSFTLGSATGDPDERPTKQVALQPYCIDRYEFHDTTTGTFVSDITWDAARDLCEDRGQELTAALGVPVDMHLCTEAQWERACIGANPQSPHPHGIMKETTDSAFADKGAADASILRTNCNQGANDPEMALQLRERDRVCVTNEGVYDMAGNLSEWVLDAYDTSAYARLQTGAQAFPTYPPMLDSVSREGDLHGFRGGNYLRPPVEAGLLQSLARCSNRDKPHAVRPVFRQSCVTGDKPGFVVIYGNELSQRICRIWPDNIDAGSVRDIYPDPADTTKLKVLMQETVLDLRLQLTGPDTVFLKMKPIRAELLKKDLMVVRYRRTSADTVTAAPPADTAVALPKSALESLCMSGSPDVVCDTLDAVEYRNNQAKVQQILDRDAGPGWEGEFLGVIYGHARIGTKPAKQFYSSRAIGLRCCSRPILK